MGVQRQCQVAWPYRTILEVASHMQLWQVNPRFIWSMGHTTLTHPLHEQRPAPVVSQSTE